MSGKILEVKNLYKSYGSFKALDGLDLSVNEGEIFGFLGANGAGKSTTIRCILTLIKPDSGEIFSLGKPTNSTREAFLKNVGSIIEKPDFYTHLTAEKNLSLSAAMYGMKSSRKQLEEALELVGLNGKENVPVKDYSQGMKQRLGIAQALIHQPKLIILDEPTNGLDPQGIIDLRNIIKSLKINFGKTVILSSHILSEIELIVDSFIIIDQGKKIVQGKASELLSEKDLLVTVETDDARAMQHALQGSAAAGKIVSATDRTLTLKSDRASLPALHVALVNSHCAVYNFTTRKRLEDLFLQLTHKH